MDLTPLIESFDFSKFSRGTPKFSFDELQRLNSKILHDTDFAAIQDRLAAMDLSDVDSAFWEAVRPNLTKLEDIKEWWRVANGPVTPVIEDSDFAAQAAELLPPAPWDGSTWDSWISSVKEQTGRKGKNLFMPIRQALTGMEHGPELPNLLPLIGREKAEKRLKSA